MRIVILHDSISESGLEDIFSALRSNGHEAFFKTKDYGVPVFFGVVFRCVQPGVVLRSRSRYTSKDHFWSVDIVLPTEEFCALSVPEKRTVIVDRLLADVSAAVKAKKLPGFDGPRFLADLKEWTDQIKW